MSKEFDAKMLKWLKVSMQTTIATTFVVLLVVVMWHALPMNVLTDPFAERSEYEWVVRGFTASLSPAVEWITHEEPYEPGSVNSMRVVFKDLGGNSVVMQGLPYTITKLPRGTRSHHGRSTTRSTEQRESDE